MILEENPSNAQKKKAVKVPWAGPNNQLNNMHLIDLFGLRADQVMSMRTVELYFDNHSEHKELFLDPTIQLSQSQGTNLFAHIARSEFASRPDGLRPTCTRPPSVEEIKEHFQAAEVEAPVTPIVESVGGAVPKVAGLQLGSMQRPSAKAKTRAGAQKRAATQSLLALGDGQDSDVPPAPPLEDLSLRSESRMSETSKQSKEKDLEEGALDDDMQKVADVHVGGPGTSVKSLAGLVPERFLQQRPADPEAAKKHQYSLSSALTGVRCL